jgi:hypothetical protein
MVSPEKHDGNWRSIRRRSLSLRKVTYWSTSRVPLRSRSPVSEVSICPGNLCLGDEGFPGARLALPLGGSPVPHIVQIMIGIEARLRPITMSRVSSSCVSPAPMRPPISASIGSALSRRSSNGPDHSTLSHTLLERRGHVDQNRGLPVPNPCEPYSGDGRDR